MKRIAMYDLEGYLLEVFEVETYRQLEIELGIKITGLNAYFSNRQNQVKNRQFRELKGDRVALRRIGDVSDLVNSSIEYKTVLKKYNGRIICAYDSIKQAAEKNNITQNALGICLQGRTKVCGGFEWEYA